MHNSKLEVSFETVRLVLRANDTKYLIISSPLETNDFHSNHQFSPVFTRFRSNHQFSLVFSIRNSPHLYGKPPTLLRDSGSKKPIFSIKTGVFEDTKKMTSGDLINLDRCNFFSASRKRTCPMVVFCLNTALCM